jgi:hypothetical protein
LEKEGCIRNLWGKKKLLGHHKIIIENAIQFWKKTMVTIEKNIPQKCHRNGFREIVNNHYIT